MVECSSVNNCGAGWGNCALSQARPMTAQASQKPAAPMQTTDLLNHESSQIAAFQATCPR